MSEMSMSLDGFIADPSDGTEQLFGWYGAGPVSVPAGPRFTFRVAETSAGLLREMMQSTGAVVSGRRLFDLTDGWGGRHPLDVPVFVVTHRVPEGWPRADAPFTFVTDGLESAVAQAKAVAGDKLVGVGGADVTQQCLNAGLLDEIRVNLVPVLLGSGIRLFDQLRGAPVELESLRVVEGIGVTHLYYRVKRREAA
jgi:dihydrofolate reductase